LGTVDAKLHTFRSPRFASVVDEAILFLENTPVHPLPPGDSFIGVGVYTLYYGGDFALYDYIKAANHEQCTQPIYVGKAVPPGWRSARLSRDPSAQTLYARLREHARSIRQAENLDSDDFYCRFMILEGIETDLVTAAEAQLIRRYTPLWNCIVDGFGNHDPGSGRYGQARSEWDVVHPGRSWVDRLTGTPPELSDITGKIESHKQ